MTDYKELIIKCEEWLEITKRLKADGLTQHIEACADAIEQLVNDRNASVDALRVLGATIDAEPVVRCKDCKYCHAGYCENSGDLIPHGNAEREWENWFCADGERKGGDE